MSDLAPRDRLGRVLSKQGVDRPPVICTGGMMNAAVLGVMEEEAAPKLPAAHFSSEGMAALAEAVHHATGFENIGVPFCMTVEAELLGSEINHGTLECEPKIVREVFPSVGAVEFRDVAQLVRSGRIEVVVEAAHRIARANPDVPVIASLTGPVSTAASIVDPLTFYKELRKNPTGAHQLLDYVTNLLGAFAERLLADQGATAIAVGDPSATGEILGPAMFEKFAVRYLNQLADRVHALGFPLIIHICGDLKSVWHLLPQLRCDALSTDALVSLPALKEKFPAITTMGNVSTFALEWNESEKIRNMTRNLVNHGVNIISPACGLSTSTKLKTIRVMTDEVKNGGV